MDRDLRGYRKSLFTIHATPIHEAELVVVPPRWFPFGPKLARQDRRISRREIPLLLACHLCQLR